ncbi:hypothetical protein MWN34_14230 [Ancylobacter sp. 6x-1]|uniref:Uncharacterized protein n=1 Tax=Ancylobacter crimeensis TaxID=2579147 RepID=A0ABT0DDX0_9HYPH|nr:hypothetical protein [Ancylobacter crimeensis]MCK0198069.1 hypothetical protein [Ancylobacter crimeensis]
MSADRSCHRLVVEADAHPNALLRVLEPFAIHEVMPLRMRLDAPEGPPVLTDCPTFHAEIAFHASMAVAERLCARIGVMPAVREARLLSAAMDVPVSEAA